MLCCIQLGTSNTSTLWTIEHDTGTLNATPDTLFVFFTTPGMKRGRISVTNSNGCVATQDIELEILSCAPQIPADVHIVTDFDTGMWQNVWVKTGGSYCDQYEVESRTARIYVEPGGSVVGTYASNRPEIYMKAGSSVTFADPPGASGLLIMDKSSVLNLSAFKAVDTLYCNDLQFDYSLVKTKSVAPTQPSRIVTHMTNDDLKVEGLPVTSTLSVFDLLGRQVIPTFEEHSPKVNIDVAKLPSGAYYLRVASEGNVVTRKFLIRR
jgi:hypothetical protein